MAKVLLLLVVEFEGWLAKRLLRLKQWEVVGVLVRVKVIALPALEEEEVLAPQVREDGVERVMFMVVVSVESAVEERDRRVDAIQSLGAMIPGQVVFSFHDRVRLRMLSRVFLFVRSSRNSFICLSSEVINRHNEVVSLQMGDHASRLPRTSHCI